MANGSYIDQLKQASKDFFANKENKPENAKKLNPKKSEKSKEWFRTNISDMRKDAGASNSYRVPSSISKGKGSKSLKGKTILKQPKPIVKPKAPKQFINVKGKQKNIDKSTLSNKPREITYKKNIDNNRTGWNKAKGETDMEYIMRQSNANKKTKDVPTAPDQIRDIQTNRIIKAKGTKGKSLKGKYEDKPDITRISKNKIKIGGMYMYSYNAKTKDKMKYFDEFPLIMFVEPSQGGWFGMNLHYVPPYVRIAILSELMSVAKLSNSENRYMQLSYSLLKKLSTFDVIKPCLKRYLFTHVQSNFYEVAPVSWHYAIDLPHASFVSYTKNKGNRTKISNTTVWADSLKG